MSKDDYDYLDRDAVYFSTRKTSKGWIAEKIYFDGDELVRERCGEPGGRAHAMGEFKIAVAKYWNWQYKNLL